MSEKTNSQKVINDAHLNLQALKNSKKQQKWETKCFNVSLMLISLFSYLSAMRDSLVLLKFFTVTFTVLVAFRYTQYKKSKEHYYFFDYCYYALMALMSMQTFEKLSPEQFAVVFLLNTQCLFNYFICFNPKLILHRIDSTTSFILHIVPSIVLYRMRFSNEDASSWGFNSLEIDQYLRAMTWEQYGRVVLQALLIYLGWALYYYLLVLRILEERVERKQNVTLYKTAVTQIKSMNWFIFALGKTYRREMYILTHIIIGIKGILISTLYLYNERALLAGMVYCVYLQFNSCSNYYTKKVSLVEKHAFLDGKTNHKQ